MMLPSKGAVPLYERAAGTLWGLMIGDAVSYPSMRRTRFIVGDWIERILPSLARNQAEHNIDRDEVPFVMSRDADLLRMGPSSRSEWSLFTAKMLIDLDGELDTSDVAGYWRQHLLPSESSVRSGVAERSAIINLSRGLEPPATGKDNPHFYDDGAVSRAVPLGIVCSGRPAMAAAFAQTEACISHADEGIWASQAMAVAISLLCDGKPAEEAVASAVDFFPSGSWILRIWEQCEEIRDSNSDLFEILIALDQYVIDKMYSYSHLAPQTLPLALSLFLAADGDFIRGVTLANCLPRVSDSVPCFMGALLGAEVGVSHLPIGWRKGMAPVRGAFVPAVANIEVDGVATRLVELATSKDLEK